MKQSIFVFILLQGLFFATACKQDSRADFSKAGMAEPPQSATTEAVQLQGMADTIGTAGEEEPPSPPQPKGQPLPTPQPPAEKIVRQIIRTAHYRIQVKDVGRSSRQANLLATRHGGYVSGSELTNSSYEITNAITIRVPASQFDSLLEDLGNEAIFTQYKRISSQDVTEEYVDITTRLKTKKEVRDRYVDILRTKAHTVKDVLAAEEQIRIIQEEIEAKEGRLRYLRDQVGMSTIQLELYQEIEFRPEPAAFRESFWVKFTSGLKNGWELLQGMVIFFVNIWPLLLLGGLIWWKRRWLVQKVRRKPAGK